MSEHLDYLIDAKAPVHVRRPCAEVRGLEEEDFIATARVQEGDQLVALAVGATVFTY